MNFDLTKYADSWGDNQNAKLAELNSGCLGGNTVDYKKRWTANCNVSAPLLCSQHHSAAHY